MNETEILKMVEETQRKPNPTKIYKDNRIEINYLVIKEATSLKKHTTEEEKVRLDFSKLSSINIHLCIYGQLTGDCLNNRSIELQNLCCKKVFNYPDFELVGISGSTIRSTPIEFFIGQAINKKNGNNAALVAFLKNETQTLELI